MMRFYNQQHPFYWGVDFHARTLFLCVLDAAGTIPLQQSIVASPDAFLEAVAPFRDGLAVSCECMFAWDWLADLCHDQGICAHYEKNATFRLGMGEGIRLLVK